MPMYANSFGSVTKVENIVKWAYKESKAGAVSDVYTIENGDESFFVIAALNKINPQGTASLEQVKPFIESTLFSEKLADNKLAEVTAKVNGMTDLKEIAKALGTTVSTKEKLTFATSDFDQKFTGAASVAQEGVVNAPFKGVNGIYVYKVTNRSEEAYFTENDANARMMQLNAAYSQMLPYVLNKEGKVKDYTYLYF
jgi:peptidyl-prolyl cis-trans isomerase D